MNIPHSRPTREEASTRTETSSSPSPPSPSSSPSSPSSLEKENGPYRSESVFSFGSLFKQTVEKGYKLSMSLSAASMESGGGPAVASKRTAEKLLSLLLSLGFF